MQEVKEVWEPIKNYEGFYEVSSLGKVRSVERKVKHWRGGLLTAKSQINVPYLTKNGYLINRISKQSVKESFLVHRLVAEAFIANPENKPQVNHINGIKTDNRVENLEWNTRSENITHADKNNLRNLKGVNNSGAKLTEIQITAIRFSNKSSKELSTIYGVSQSCINKIIKKVAWKHI